MSKYDSLGHYLHRLGSQRVKLTFSEIEQVLGFGLPDSARKHPAWWSNSGGSHVQSASWMDEGYRTEDVDLHAERLVFAKAEGTPAGFSENRQGEYAAPVRKHPLFGCMKGTSIVLPGVDLTKPVDPEWAKVYDDDYDVKLHDE